MERHGGHALAAGFTIKTEKLPELLDCLRDAARNKLAGQDLRPTLLADAEIHLEELRQRDFLKYLDMLQPTGQSNAEALFLSRGVKIVDVRYMGAEKQHVKFKVEVPFNMGVLDLVAFRQADKAAGLRSGDRIDVMFNFERNEFNGFVTPQMNARDFRRAEMAE
jgi:single-stranded-DNA-specific exonuclease